MGENHFKNLLLEQTKDLIWMIDSNYQLVYANKSYLNVMKEISGKEVILNTSVFIEESSDEYLQKWKNYYNKALKGDYFQIEEQPNHTDKLFSQYNQITFEPLIGDDNTIIGVSCQSKDITSLVNQRNDSEKRYNALIQQGHDMIAIINPDGIYNYCNPTSTSILGFYPEKFIGKNIMDFIHPEDVDTVLKALQNIAKDIKVILNCIRFQNHKLEWRCMEMTLTNMLENPSLKGIVINFRDITEEQKLRELNRQVSKIAKIGSWEVDIKNQQIYWSNEVHDMHETDPNTFVPNLETAINFYREDFRELIQLSIQKCISKGEPFDLEAVLVTANKKEIWVRAIGHADFNKNNECTRVYGSFQNISDIKNTENRLYLFSENIPGVIYQYIIHPDGTDSMEHLSGMVEQLWGRTIAEVNDNLEILWNQIRLGGDLELVQNSIEKSIRTKSKWSCRYKFVMPDGKIKTHLGNGTPIFMADGRIVISVIILDITKEVKNEELLTQASEMARIGSWEMNLLNKEDEGVYFSSMIKEIVGIEENYKPSLKGAIEFCVGESKEILKQATINLINHGIEYDIEILFRSVKGIEHWVRIIGKSDTVNNIRTRAYGSFQDITKSKIAEQSVRENEEKNRLILNSALDAIIWMDLQGKITFWNPQAEEIFGWKQNEILGQKFSDFIIPKHLRSMHDNGVDNYSKTGDSKVLNRVLELIALNKKGEIFPVELTVIPIKINNEEFFCSFIRDITLRKKAEQEKNSLQITLENSLNEIFIFDTATFKIKYANRGALLNLGYSESEIKELTPFDIKVDVTEDAFKELIRPLLNNEKEKIIFFNYHKRKDGTFYPAEIHLQLVKGETENIFLAISLDITERKKAEEDLVKANERFEKVTEATNDVVWDWDLVNNTFYRSKAIERIYGEKTSKFFTQNEFWKDNFYPEDLDKIKNSISEAISNPSVFRWELEYRIIDINKKTLFIIDRGIIIRDKDGNATRMVGTMSDISEQKLMNVELEKLNKSLKNYTVELERSNKELEQFAFIASHDLQEPLRMITSFMALFLRKYGDEIDDNGKKYILFATDGAKRMKQIMLDLLEYSRASRPIERKEEIDVNEVIFEYKQLRRKIISEKSAKITYSNLPFIHTHKAAVTQIFHCLLDNSLKYSKENTACKINIKSTEKETEWLFSVKDNGIGIDSEFFEKIFIIFQRLHSKDKYSGTGIGLTIAKRHVEFLGGKIWLESKPDEGTIFYFTIAKTL